MKKGKIFKTLAVFGACLTAPILFTGCGKDEDKFYITFMANGQTYKVYETTENQNITNIPNPTKEGYSFEGWFSDENYENEILDLAEYLLSNSKSNTTLYAKFSISQFTISFNANGGTSVAPITQDYGTNITAPEEPQKEGFVFVGWYKDSSLTQSFTFNLMPAQNITLYAKYEAMFNVSGGTITGLTSYAKNKAGLELVIPEKINGYNITSISDNAFLSNSNIVSLTIGNNVTTIGDNAFARCSKLTTVVIPNSVTTMGENVFFQCSKLTTATIGTGLKVLPNATFGECPKLTNLTLSEGLTKIGELAIARCTSLTEITIPNSVTELQYGALAQNSALTTVNMGTGVRTLGESVFLSDTNLTTINLPEGIQTISKGLFGGCSSLESLVLPSTVTTIADSVFASCSSLKSISIPKSVTSIGKTVFQQCENLETVTFATDGVLSTVGDYLFQECSKLKTVNFPTNLQTLSKGMFYKCSKLQNITLPTELRTISQSAFYQCSSLDVLIIPSKVTKIESLAFESCSEVYVYIPSSVTTIESKSSYGENATYSPFHSSYARIYCEVASAPSGWSEHWNKSSSSGMRPVEWNTTLEEFDEITRPYRNVVAQINSNLEEAKTIFNNVINSTITTNEDVQMFYEDGTVFGFSALHNYIYWTTENTEYLQLYKNDSNLMYSAHYSANDAANGYGYIQAMDITMVEDESFDSCVRNHLHAIYNITAIEAIESFDYYTMKVTVSISPKFNIELEYRIIDGKIKQIYDGEQTILFGRMQLDYTLSSNPFSALKTLYIDETFIEDTSLVDFTMLDNVETIYISNGLDIPTYITEHFELVDDDFMYKIYQIKVG